MRKLSLAVVLCLAMVCSAFAFSVTDLPNLKQGVMYLSEESEFEYIATTPLLEWKSFNLEIGYVSEESIIGVISYPLFKLQEWGVTMPILDLIGCNIGIAAGYDELGGNNEFIWGVTATFLEISW